MKYLKDACEILKKKKLLSLDKMECKYNCDTLKLDLVDI